ncbi:hypothetical protein CTA1_3122 [Colletotrichum tanaceti]|uniref:Uncharacterized protein n=1 Tax=Colletotrichum tanaceti TaxID=1306861 RepID=A0A4U6XVL3_9PEZI|nr:hypothetical protein CTA1_3122 [Colletotrichum tanaceti]
MPPQDDDSPPHKKAHKDFDITRASRHKLKKQLAKMQTDGPSETPPETADSQQEDTETASKDHPQELQKLHVPQGGQDGHESQDLGDRDPRVPQGPHESQRPHMPVQINDNRRISITNNHNHSTHSSSNNYNHTTSKGGNTTNTTREEDKKEVEEEQDEVDDKDARRSTIGRRPLSLWIPRFVWAAVQRTARATVPARWLLICTGEFLLFPVIGLGTLSALFPEYVPGPWEMTKWGLVTIFVRASSPTPTPTPTPFPSPSPLPVMPLPSSSSSSSPSVFTPSSVFENPETLKRLMTDVFSTGAWLDGYAGHPSALSGPLRTLAQTSVGRFMNLHTYQLFVNLETAVDRDFPRALASTLGELRLNADDIARYPSRFYVAPTASSGSSTLSRLYRSVANVVGATFRGRAQPTPTPLPVSRAMARVAAAGTLLDAAGASLGEAMKSFPPGQSVSDGACRWASQLKGVAGSVRRMGGGSWSSQPLLASPRPSSSSSDYDDDGGSRPADVVDGSEDKAMGNVMDQQNVLQVVESSRNEAEYLCAVMKGDTAARIENARQRLDDYARHLRGWKMRVGDLEKTFVSDEGSVKVWESPETLDAVLDETDGKLVRLYTEVDLFLREAFATEGNHEKRA